MANANFQMVVSDSRWTMWLSLACSSYWFQASAWLLHFGTHALWRLRLCIGWGSSSSSLLHRQESHNRISTKLTPPCMLECAVNRSPVTWRPPSIIHHCLCFSLVLSSMLALTIPAVWRCASVERRALHSPNPRCGINFSVVSYNRHVGSTTR